MAIGKRIMLTKAPRGRWLVAVGAVGVLLAVVVLTLRAAPAGPSDDVNKFAPARPAASTPPAAAAAVAPIHERRDYIVQSESADSARGAVRAAGGVVTSDLGVIRGVGAALDDQELRALRDQQNPHLQVYDDTQVSASSVGALPETYYPSEVDASNLHIGGVMGQGVTVAGVDTGKRNPQGPFQYSPGGRSRVLAQYDVILARQQPSYYLSPWLETYSRNIDDPYGHGTHVTSIIASSGLATTGKPQGFAPGVNLV